MADDKKIIFSMVGVSKIFPPQKQVLKNIYLSFFYGAKIGIIGLNGSGKSTLLKIIAGLDKDFLGEVVFSPGYTVGYLFNRDPHASAGLSCHKYGIRLGRACSASDDFERCAEYSRHFHFDKLNTFGSGDRPDGFVRRICACAPELIEPGKQYFYCLPPWQRDRKSVV